MSFAEETQFLDQGSLDKPLTVGRLVRFALGVFMLYGLYQTSLSWPSIVERGFPVHRIDLWITTVLAFWTMPSVINIGFALNTGHLSQRIIVGTSLALGAYHYFANGSVLGNALGIFTVAWVSYWLFHLGLSFILAASLATPGCEMRSIPQLWTLATGRATKEHYCPGFLDKLDRWERGRAA